MPSPDDPASALGGRRRLLRPACGCMPVVHPRTGDVCWPMRFNAGRDGPGYWRAARHAVTVAARVRVSDRSAVCDVSLHRARRRPPRVMRRRCWLSRRSATRSHGHVAWSVPFRCRSFCEFPSRERGRSEDRSFVTRVTVFAFDAFPDGAPGVHVFPPFAGLLPRTGEARVSAAPDPLAVRPPIGRGVLAARPAGPGLKRRALRISAAGPPHECGG